MTPIRIEGRYGGPALRDSVVLAFFRQAPFAEWAEEVGAVFEAFLEVATDRAMTRARVGARATRVGPVYADTLARCRAQLDPAKAAQRKLSAFFVGGPEPVNPSWGLELWGGGDAVAEDDCARTNYVVLRMPTEWAGEGGEQLEALALRLASELTFDSGYASLALQWSNDAERVRVLSKIAGLALRHPGLDLPDLAHLRFSLGRRCVGARWLTLLVPELTGACGGADALRERLGDAVAVRELDEERVVLRMVGAPRPGDVNRGDPLPELRAMAAALEPVTHFPLDSLVLPDPSVHERWERRLLD